MTKPQLPSSGQEDYSRRPLIAPGTGYHKGKALVKVNFSHDAIIDVLLANPRISQQDLAKQFGYTAGWICRMINSDAFQARIAERKAMLVDPGVAAQLNARLAGVAIQAMDVISRKLDATENAQLALDALGISTKGAVAVRGEGK